jgi:nitroimidazol reductase NimA-like FMN-containing flavoprotein (pyridoxamine 5'-phosphate oxidase superfamily)
MTYTQSPHLTDKEIEGFLREAQVARLCSHNRDGTIHAAPVFFRHEEGRIVFGTPEKSRKARNITRDANVTLLIDMEGPPAKGVIVYGMAETEKMDIGEREHFATVVWLFEKYMSHDEATSAAQGLFRLTTWIKVTVHPSQIGSFDYAKGETYRKAVRG